MPQLFGQPPQETANVHILDVETRFQSPLRPVQIAAEPGTHGVPAEMAEDGRLDDRPSLFARMLSPGGTMKISPIRSKWSEPNDRDSTRVHFAAAA